LIDEAERGKRPEMARAMLVAATTGLCERSRAHCGGRATSRVVCCECRRRREGARFTDSADGSEPWKPDTISQYFGRMRTRVGLDHLDFHDLRKLMETYGQEMATASHGSPCAPAMTRAPLPSTTAAGSARPTEHSPPLSRR
jgi:hypothetical protein